MSPLQTGGGTVSQVGGQLVYIPEDEKESAGQRTVGQREEQPLSQRKDSEHSRCWFNFVNSFLVALWGFRGILFRHVHVTERSPPALSLSLFSRIVAGASASRIPSHSEGTVGISAWCLALRETMPGMFHH